MFIDNYLNNKITYVNTTLIPIPLLTYDEEHLKKLNLLMPLIGVPWFIGVKLFMKEQWTPDLIVLNTEVGVINYEIVIDKHKIKCCNYHKNIIKSIYEIIKEITVLENKIYFNNIPCWLGLTVNDIVAYHVHLICVDECLEVSNLAIANQNIKMFLINREEKILELILNSKKFQGWDDFKDANYHNYSAINLLFDLIKKYSNLISIERLLENFKKQYKAYLASLKSNLWVVAYVDNDGRPQIHKNKGRIPNYNPSKYNQILYFAK
jgi:hypothetical protein